MSRPFNTGASVSGTSESLKNCVERAWMNYRVLSKAPDRLGPACNGILSTIGALRLIDEHFEENELSTGDQRTLYDLEIGCNAVFLELETAMTNFRLHEISLEAVAGVQSKIADQTNLLTKFLEALRSTPQDRILNILIQIHDIKPGDFQRSIMTDWEVLEAELQKLGLPKALVEEEFFFIDNWLKENSPAEEQEDESLPGYSPGAKRGTVEEKVQSLEQTMRLMTLSNPVEQIATPSKAAPPAYTFEEGSDEVIDDEFSQYIRKATDIEANRLFLERERNPELATHTTLFWLPKTNRGDYRGREDVIQVMDAKSFTTMAYDTAPRCVDEIDRMTRFLRQSLEYKSTGSNDPWVIEAFESLRTLFTAMTKFTVLQDQRSGKDNFSDLDTLEFEYSTAAAIDEHLHFPEREFELAQKSYYLLLTYIMGMLELFSDVFPGRGYVTRSHKDLEFLWKDKKMRTRTAWVEKQLAGWDRIDDAVLYCRDWHRLRPNLRMQALAALKDWQRAERMISGSEDDDVIELKVVAASSLPKSSFRTPNAWARVVVYGTNQFDSPMRLFDLKTELSQKSQNPVWNKSFPIKLRNSLKMIDVELYDRVAGIDKELSRVRLKMSYIQGVEANFANRSLIYGIDEEIDFPLKITDGKGKEKEPPLLRIGLTWIGRQTRVEELGLPTRAPGKMFRTDIIGIPMSLEEREARKPKPKITSTFPYASGGHRARVGV